MIHINKNTTNSIYCSITSNVSNKSTDNPIMKLIGCENRNEITINLGLDLSSNPQRFNLYSYTETGSLTQRHYEYYIYYSGGVTLAEKGLLQVDNADTGSVKYTYTDKNQTYTFE